MRSLLFIFVLLVLFIGLFTSCGSDGGANAVLRSVPSFDYSKTTNSSTVVDRNDDEEVADPSCTDAPKDCTLRSAIDFANSHDMYTNITFATHYMIELDRPLPPLSAPHTTLQARPDQEVHINGHKIDGSVLQITGNFITVSGLRVYGAGDSHPNIWISDTASNVVIENNIIGDGDGPAGDCDSSYQSGVGILISPSENSISGKKAWIYGNIIECHEGYPGEGITVFANNVVIGRDKQGKSGTEQRNRIRENKGVGINLNDSSRNVVSNCELSNNNGGALSFSSLNNDFMNNAIED